MSQILSTDALNLIRVAIDAAPVHARSPDDPSLIRWRQRTKVDLGTVFGSDSSEVADFANISFFRLESDIRHNGSIIFDDGYKKGVDRGFASAIPHLEALRDRMMFAAQRAAILPAASRARSNRVFIVHGHDGALQQASARCVENLGLEPIILAERPNQGRTLVEKLEQESVDCGFAIVLATGDDIGALARMLGESEPGRAADAFQSRARQNVILELGFFLGKLGRGNVMLVADENLELPSDYYGVAFTKKAELPGRIVAELEAAGFDFGAEAKRKALTVSFPRL